LTALVKNAKKVRNEAKEQQPSKRIENQEIYTKKKEIYMYEKINNLKNGSEVCINFWNARNKRSDSQNKNKKNIMKK